MDMNPESLYKPCSRLSKYIFQSVFEDMTMYCMQRKAINMAQGFPDWRPPSIIKEGLEHTIPLNEDQYTRVGGHPELVKAISKQYGPLFGREIDPMKEVTVTNGGVGVINNFFFTFLEEGDEVILFEPTFPFVYPMVDLYRGKVVFSSLIPPKGDSTEWTFDFEKLEKLFNEKTKAIVINTPHNPTGKALKKSECERIIQILEKWPKVLVLADEVYEHIVYDKAEHVRIGSFPKMWDRTVSVYSGGKIFSVTGWRIGWGVGAPHLIKPLIAAQNWTTFSVNRPAQIAVAEALNKANLPDPKQNSLTFYQNLKETFQKKKELVIEQLKKASFKYKILNPEGGYFIIVDITECIPSIPTKYFYHEEKSEEVKPVEDFQKLENPDFTPDYAFVRWLLFEYGIGAIPLFPFYEQSTKGPKEQKGTTFIRFTICKEDETILAVGNKLSKL